MNEISQKFYESIQEAQRQYWQKKRHPIVAGLELTPFCNMRCVHCYLNDGFYDKPLDTDQWKLIIDKLYDQGVLMLYMTGGEIFTRNDFLDIYIYAKSKGFIIELLTNITLLSQKHIDVFLEYPPATISTSVYGIKYETYEKVTRTQGSFAKFMSAINMLKKAELDFELKFVGLKENSDDFLEAEQFAKNLGVNFKFNFEIFPTLQGGSENLTHRVSNEDIITIEKNNTRTAKAFANNVYKSNPFLNMDEVPLFTCNMAETLCFIDYKGFMNPCHKMRLKAHNLLHENFQDIWEDFIQKYAYQIAPRNFKCAKCPNIHICSPCAVINKLSTGSYAIPCEEYCTLTKLRVLEYSKSEYDKYRK